MCLANFCLTHPIEICSTQEVMKVPTEQLMTNVLKHQRSVGAYHGETAVHEKHQVR